MPAAMSKIAQALLIGFLVAFAVGGGIAFLEASVGAPVGNEAVLAGAGLGVAAGFIFANLSANRRSANASEAERQQALTGAPPPGKALLFLYRRGYVAKLVGMDFAVDGRAVAQLKSPHFTCVVIQAGPHTVHAAFGGFAGSQARAAECPFTAEPGGVVTIGARMKMGLVQGGIGLTLDANPAQIRADLARRDMTAPDVAEL